MVVGDEVGPKRRKSLRRRFSGQTIGCRAELRQKHLGFGGRGIDEPLGNAVVAVMVVMRRQTAEASPP